MHCVWLMSACGMWQWHVPMSAVACAHVHVACMLACAGKQCVHKKFMHTCVCARMCTTIKQPMQVGSACSQVR